VTKRARPLSSGIKKKGGGVNFKGAPCLLRVLTQLQARTAFLLACFLATDHLAITKCLDLSVRSGGFVRLQVDL
jgi:hypothetical protein